MGKNSTFDLKHIESFLVAVEEKSFTRASRTLGLGQATISNHIHQLEKYLGVNIISRSSRAFSLTSEGEIFKNFCDTLVKDLQKLEADLGSERRPGLVTIASSTIPSTYLLPAVLPGVFRRCPGVLFRFEVFDSREAVERVKDRQADAAVTGKLLKHPSLAYNEICEDEIVLAAPPGMFSRSIGIVDLKTAPLVLREKGSGTRYFYEEFLNRNGIRISELNAVLECSTSESVREAVLSGVGAAFISKFAVIRELEAGALEEVSLWKTAIKRKFYMATLKGKIMGKPLKTLLEELKTAVSERQRRTGKLKGSHKK